VVSSCVCREYGSRPVLERLHAYLLEIQDQLLPKSEAGQAWHILKNWTTLTRYCENPDLSIDNNHTERALRGFAVGRANWTFFGSDRGGMRLNDSVLVLITEPNRTLLLDRCSQQLINLRRRSFHFIL
jgi:hypothetical protein